MNTKLIAFFLILFLFLKTNDAWALKNQNQDSTKEQMQTQQEMNVQNQPENGYQKSNQNPNNDNQQLNPRSDNARQHMNEVAKTVENLLNVPNREGGIGQQIREVARLQNQSQLQIEQNLNKMQSKNNFMKKIFGPDFAAIKNLQKHMEQNQLRIQQLQQLQTQTQNQSEQMQIQQAINAMQEQNTTLKETIVAESNVNSLLGWLFKLIP